jgi:hypothetical protein
MQRLQLRLSRFQPCGHYAYQIAETLEQRRTGARRSPIERDPGAKSPIELSTLARATIVLKQQRFSPK